MNFGMTFHSWGPGDTVENVVMESGNGLAPFRHEAITWTDDD